MLCVTANVMCYNKCCVLQQMLYVTPGVVCYTKCCVSHQVLCVTASTPWRPKARCSQVSQHSSRASPPQVRHAGNEKISQPGLPTTQQEKYVFLM